MSFQPIIPLGGVAGWEFLKRTKVRQEKSFGESRAMQTTTSSFIASFSNIRTAQELVDNRQALSVVLGAYGLQDDLGNRAFIRKVISDGVQERGALANRLADKRYLALATELAHLAPGGTGAPPNGLADRLVRKYKAAAFEIAVGNNDQTMRFSLAFARKLPEIAATGRSDEARWFQILGDPPTRRVLETALGLPKEFAALDIDDQVVRLQKAVAKRFSVSSVQDMAMPDKIEAITKRYLLMDQLGKNEGVMTGASVALSLLSSR